jgi:hypothetical protein
MVDRAQVRSRRIADMRSLRETDSMHGGLPHEDATALRDAGNAVAASLRVDDVTFDAVRDLLIAGGHEANEKAIDAAVGRFVEFLSASGVLDVALAAACKQTFHA